MNEKLTASQDASLARRLRISPTLPLGEASRFLVRVDRVPAGARVLGLPNLATGASLLGARTSSVPRHP
jgi:hypothetical protein